MRGDVGKSLAKKEGEGAGGGEPSPGERPGPPLCSQELIPRRDGDRTGRREVSPPQASDELTKATGWTQPPSTIIPGTDSSLFTQYLEMVPFMCV